MNIKRVKYDEKIGNIFDVEEVNGEPAIKENGEFFNGKLELIYPDGSIQSQGMIENGLKEGVWETYDGNGLIESTEEMKKGKINGKYKEYDKNGILKIEIDFVNGKQNGKYKLFYETGELQLEGDVKDDLHHGNYKSFYKNGKLHQEVNFVNNSMEGKKIEYYESGLLKVEAVFKNNKQNGKTIFYYENGNISSEGNYKNDKKDGEWKVYYENSGDLKIKYNEIDGIINGIYTIYYEKSDIPFKIKNENKEKKFIKSESVIIDGKLEGEYKSYFPNGNKKEIGNYKNNEKDGLWLKYSQNKSYIVNDEIKYKNGKEMEKKVYDDDRYLIFYSYWKDFEFYEDYFNKKENLIKRNVYKENIITGSLRKYEEIHFDENGNISFQKNYGKRFLENDDPSIIDYDNFAKESIELKKEKLIIEQQLPKEKERQEKIKNTFDEIRIWLLDLLDQKDKVVFPKKEFLEKIKDFNESEKERTLRVIRYFHSEKKYKLKDDYGNIIEGFNVIKEFGNMLGIVVEESEDTKETEKQEIIQKTEVNEDENLTPEQLRKKYFLQRMKKEEEK